MEQDSIKQKTIHGFKWLFMAKISEKVLSFTTFVILARMLSPSDFGIFAMAFIIIDGLNLFQNIGIDVAIIQDPEEDEIALHTGFFIFPLFGL